MELSKITITLCGKMEYVSYRWRLTSSTVEQSTCGARLTHGARARTGQKSVRLETDGKSKAEAVFASDCMTSTSIRM
jgi:hypothetical protein